MTPPARHAAVRWGALVLGVVLFFATLYYIDFRTALGTIRRLGIALPLALLFSGLWHLVRTWAWAWCFPKPRRVSFGRLLRVRLSAEAFSYLTLRGIAGEPLKVVLLADSVGAREATAAVALERLAYLIGTTIIIGVGSICAMIGLPLKPVWFHVFRAFAIAAGVVAVLAALVIGGRGTYLQSALARVDALLGTAMAEGRVARFVSAVERQMLDLVRGNPTRLLVLVVATFAAYVCMGLEAWVILRASGASISPNGALAVETFSRVASFASSFIPANLGALEASSLAAVTAVGAVGSAAALALGRRLRGLFWAGVGLAIYPRRTRTREQTIGATAPIDSTRPRPTLLYFPQDAAVRVSACAPLAGLPIAERVIRSALRAGYSRIVIWAPGEPCRKGAARRLIEVMRSPEAHVTVAGTLQQWRDALGTVAPVESVTAIGAGTVVSPALLEAARTIRAAAGEPRDVAAGGEWPESGVIRAAADDATDPENLARALAARRDRALPLPSGEDVSDGRAALALRIVTAADLQSAERTIRRAIYKPTDATLAQFNRRMSLPISIPLLRTPITANQISVTLVALGFYSAWLFSLGHYWTGVLGAFLSLAASVLDGCDGEIARLKYQESAVGCWIETFGDYSYYIAIFVGLTIGALRQTQWEGFYWLGAVALAGTLLSFALLIFLRNRITAGRPERLHEIARARFQADPTLWSRVIWQIAFVATRSAMPYGIMALSLVNMLPAVVVLAAVGANVYWMSLVLKLRILLGTEETVTA